jgi:hypothetical protein
MRRPLSTKRRKSLQRPRTKSRKRAAREASQAPCKPQNPKPASKLGKILALLERPQGAALGELVGATGWRRHSVRGAPSGAVQRRMGHKLVCDKVGAMGRYRMAPVAIESFRGERRP